ncbi:ComF family protein [Lacipirellula sp.]|uniref:ComF family protein n=1 Tax=Lacipirellula sp. TaxID=2691419 RepID=UPI003D0FFCE9
MPPPLATSRRWWSEACRAGLDLLFPRRCVACNDDLLSDDSEAPSISICSPCQGKLELIDWPVCPRCAAPVPATGGVTLDCNHCRGDKLRFQRSLALGSYEGLLRQLVMRTKIDRNGVAANSLMELAWRRFESQLAELDIDIVTAVPMHRWKRWQRGVNGPLIMARRIAERLHAPCWGEMVRLVRNVPPQVGLSRPARFRNLAGEMVVGPSYHLRAARVLIVDDILTTGATCSEAARVLLRAGAAEVTVLVPARTPA